jgi:tetratricopeptide (TPR) repeat protein
VALSRLGRGQALIRSGAIDDGVVLLDEAMAAVDAGGLGPVAIGIIYCAVIEICHEIFDLGRAKEWTAALSDWCASQPELVPFRGECLVRRAEILRLQGDWVDALEEARRAIRLLTGPSAEPGAGAAFYQQAELHRLRGEFPEAEEAYREANRRGRTPQPGLGRLRLAQGRVGDAEAAIRRVLEEAATPAQQSKVLPAYVEIMLAVGDAEAARIGSETLSGIAAELDAPFCTPRPRPPGEPSASRRAIPAPPSASFAPPGRPGRRWTRPTRPPAFRSCSPGRAVSWATRIRRRWSWRGPPER